MDQTVVKYLETGGVFAILLVVLWFYRRDTADWRALVEGLLGRAHAREDILSKTVSENTEAIGKLCTMIDTEHDASRDYQTRMRGTADSILASAARLEGTLGTLPKVRVVKDTKSAKPS